MKIPEANAEYLIYAREERKIRKRIRATYLEQMVLDRESGTLRLREFKEADWASGHFIGEPVSEKTIDPERNEVDEAKPTVDLSFCFHVEKEKVLFNVIWGQKMGYGYTIETKRSKTNPERGRFKKTKIWRS